MADVMGGASAGGDGGDDGRQPIKPQREWWDYHLNDADGNISEQRLKTKEWAKVGRDGRKVCVEVDDDGVPFLEGGGFLRQFLGKAVRQKYLSIGPDDWHDVTDAEKEAVWDNLIKPKFTWNDDDDEDVRRFIFMDMGKKWRERRNHLWVDRKCDVKKSCKWNCAKKPEGIGRSDWEQFVKYKLGAKQRDDLR
ncbi:hypothetical protein LINPERHAP1_LOCUS28877 [Linum perenne]